MFTGVERRKRNATSEGRKPGGTQTTILWLSGTATQSFWLSKKVTLQVAGIKRCRSSKRSVGKVEGGRKTAPSRDIILTDSRSNLAERRACLERFLILALAMTEEACRDVSLSLFITPVSGSKNHAPFSLSLLPSQNATRLDVGVGRGQKK